MKIAYILLVHKNPEQVNMFLRQLISDEEADVYMHIDKNSIEEMSGRLIKDPRIFMTSENVSVSWGDISIVDATIILLREVIKSGKKYDYVCLRSGQDMMIRSGYSKYLEQNMGKNFFEIYYEINKQGAFFRMKLPKPARQLHDNMHPARILRALLTKLYKLGINLFPVNENFDSQIKIFKGSEWFAITSALAEHMVEYCDANRWYYDAFKDLYVVDNIFFITIAKNSPFSETIVNETHTYEYWGDTYQSRHHPVVFTYENVGEIEKSGRFFARKFDISVDREAIEYFLRKTNGM